MKRTLVSLAVIVVASTFILWLTGSLEEAFGWNDGPVAITVSKETTFVDGPLRPDGTVDYIGAVNAPLADLDPNDNAAVLLVKAIGPKSAPKETAAEFYRLLKCEAPPEQGEYLVELDELLKRKKIDDDQILKEYERKQLQFWTAATHPLFAELLKVNEKPLALVVEASRRKAFRAPMVTAKNPPMLMGCSPDFLQHTRTAARLLCLRAMNRFAEGRVDEGFHDLDACHRLANLIGEPPKFVVEALVATTFRRAALAAENTVAFSGRLSVEALRRRARVVEALPLAMEGARLFADWERLSVLNVMDAVLTHGTEGVFPSGGQLPSPPRIRPPRSTVAFDEALRTVNGVFDEIVEALEIAEPKARHAAMAKVQKKFSAMVTRAKLRQEAFGWFRSSGPPNPRGAKARAGQEAAEAVLSLYLPAFQVWEVGQTRSIAAQRQAVLAYALAAYKLTNDRYPERLVAGEPGVRPETLIDPPTGDPFVYRVVGGKRQVVSVNLEARLTAKDDMVLELP